MTPRPIALALVLVLVACGKDEPGKDWSGKPLDATIEDKVNGKAFRILAPKGMKLDDIGGAGPDAISKHWLADVGDYFSEPSFTVSYDSIPAKDLDGFLADAMLDDKDVVAKKEATADGFVLVTHTKNKGIVRAFVGKAKGDVHLKCRASQARTGGVPNPDATMAWLERLCLSLTIL